MGGQSNGCDVAGVGAQVGTEHRSLILNHLPRKERGASLRLLAEISGEDPSEASSSSFFQSCQQRSLVWR